MEVYLLPQQDSGIKGPELDKGMKVNSLVFRGPVTLTGTFWKEIVVFCQWQWLAFLCLPSPSPQSIALPTLTMGPAGTWPDDTIHILFMGEGGQG